MHTERITFDLAEPLLKRLDEVAAQQFLSRAAALREAIKVYVNWQPSDMDENGE
jgi:metal-responsive CopG/Arc/MetJ family transcriptional regulator